MHMCKSKQNERETCSKIIECLLLKTVLTFLKTKNSLKLDGLQGKCLQRLEKVSCF